VVVRKRRSLPFPSDIPAERNPVTAVRLLDHK
jgi:hypothetical protein